MLDTTYIKTETILCEDPLHAHGTPVIKVMHVDVCGHAVVIETEQNSLLYSVWVDDQERAAFITAKK